MIFAPEQPTDDRALLLFTDPVAAARADGKPIGVFMRDFSGVQIFEALDDRYGAVRVNPYSPNSEAWYLGPSAFAIARLWAKVVHLEESIAQDTSTIPYAQIAAHPGFMVLINSQNLPIPTTLQQPPGSYAIAFTAPDHYQRFVSRQPAENQANMKYATLDGVTMCKQLERFDVAGVIIYYGPRGLVLRKEDFAKVQPQTTASA
jgi:hypothetical protein